GVHEMKMGRDKKTALAPEKRLQMKKSTTKKKVLKINFRRVLLGFFENWDKSPQKKRDKGGLRAMLDFRREFG
ncbi:MAG: hypothetical protein IKB76_05655, partial [Kiritimatiellae bacterium]|nr:hypothetical protein [Kiritimatiellia bacterium]